MATMYFIIKQDIVVRLFLAHGSFDYDIDAGNYAVYNVDGRDEMDDWRIPTRVVQGAEQILMEQDDGKWKVIKNRSWFNDTLPEEKELMWLKLSSKPLVPANHG